MAADNSLKSSFSFNGGNRILWHNVFHVFKLTSGALRVSIFLELWLPTVTLDIFLWCWGLTLVHAVSQKGKCLAWPGLFLSSQLIWRQVNGENTTGKNLSYVCSPKARAWSLAVRLNLLLPTTTTPLPTFPAQLTKQIKQMMGTKATVAVGSGWTSRSEKITAVS